MQKVEGVFCYAIVSAVKQRPNLYSDSSVKLYNRSALNIKRLGTLTGCENMLCHDFKLIIALVRAMPNICVKLTCQRFLLYSIEPLFPSPLAVPHSSTWPPTPCQTFCKSYLLLPFSPNDSPVFPHWSLTFPQFSPGFPQAKTTGSSLPAWLGISQAKYLEVRKDRYFVKICNGDRGQILILP